MSRLNFNQGLNKISKAVSELLKTRPLAVFSIMTFVCIILRLYFPVEPLFLMWFLLGIVLIYLNIKGFIDNFIAVFIFLAVFVGIFSANHAIYKNTALTQKYNGQSVRVVGVVASIPEETRFGTSFYLDADRIYSHRGTDNNLKLYVTCDKNTDICYGEEITFNANLYTSGSNNVKFSKHYLAKGVPLTADAQVIINREKAKFPSNIVPTIRNYILSAGDRFLPGDEQMLFKALIAGDKSGFSAELASNLSKSGLSHIACVSGLHVSILGMAIYNLLRRKNRYISAVVAICVVYLFTLVTGAAPSTVRAAIMMTSFLAAKMIIRDNDSFTALSFSAMVLAIINPYVIYDWGFILSFLSVLGIQIFSAYFKDLFKVLPEFISDSVSVTISAQLMTMPALANMFGYLSVHSILANLLVAFVFTVTLYLCFVYAVLSFVPFVNTLLMILCTFFLNIIVSVAGVTSNLPYATIGITSLEVTHFVVYYVLVLMFVFRRKISFYFMSAMIFVCAVVLILGTYCVDSGIREYTICDESFVFIKEGKTVVLSNDNLDEIADELKNWSRGLQIDALIVANDDYGQEDGLIDITRLGDVEKVLLPSAMKNSNIAVAIGRLGIKAEYYEQYEDNAHLIELAKNMVN